MPSIFSVKSRMAAIRANREQRAGSADSAQSSDSAPASQRVDDELLQRMRAKQAASIQATPIQATFTQATPVQATSRTSSSTPTKPHNANDDDWEAQAMKGIKKKNLSLDRGWNEKTWTQKSTCLERLKLLKDDGVSITSLKGPKLISPDITRAVIARVAARNHQSSAHAAPLPAIDHRMDTSGVEEGVEEAAVASTHDPVIVNNDNRPLGSIMRKRARDDRPEVEVSHRSHATTEPRHKKACRKDLQGEERIKEHVKEMEQDELIMDWDVLKRQVLTRIFTSDPALFEDKARITINFPSQSNKAAVSGSLELNSKGYDKIMEDLSVLSDGEVDDGNFELRGEHSSIRVITNVPSRTIIEGPFRAVMGILERLRQPRKGLAHMARRYFNDEGVRQAEGILYELSAKTQQELEQIGAALTVGREAGNAEVQVLWVWDPVKAVPWPMRLY